MIKKVIGFAALLSVFTLAGCGDDEGGGSTAVNFNRQEMLISLADKVIIPAYASLNTEVSELDVATSTFVATPNQENLVELRGKFNDAYIQWQKSSFWEFGPAFDSFLKSSLNSFPGDNFSIETNITSGTIDFSGLNGRDERGFPAMDYLLHGLGENDDAILSKYTEANSDNYKNYLAAVAKDIATRVKQVNNAWDASGDNYRQTFIDKDGTGVGGSIGLIVNELNRFIEINARDGKIGIPLGKRSQGILIPANVEAIYSGMSIPLAVANLQAMKNFFAGDGDAQGIGLYEYLKELKTDYKGVLLADAILNQFDKAISEVALIESPFDESLNQNKTDKADEAYVELQRLVILLKVDMPSALGVLITYQDNDGD